MAKHRIEVKLVRDGQDAVRKDAKLRHKQLRNYLKENISNLRNALKGIEAYIRRHDLTSAVMVLDTELSEASMQCATAYRFLGTINGMLDAAAQMERAVFEGNRKQSNKEE